MADFTLSDYKLQAYLLANAEELIKQSGRADGAAFHQYIKKLSGSGNEESIAANALNPAKTVDFVSNLPADVLQKLKLEVKVYKVFIVNQEQGTHEYEMLLDAFNAYPEDADGNTIYQALNRARVGNRSLLETDEIRKQNPGDPGVQIENIEIVRLGGNPAEIDTNITVKISLFATSLQHYFTTYKGEGAGRIVSDDSLPQHIRDQATRGISWIDLIKINLEDGGLDPFENVAKKFGIDTKQSLQNNVFGSSLGYNSEQQRIKLKIGYRNASEALTEAQETDDDFIYTNDEIQNFIAQIEAQTEVYYLNLHQNAFGFNADDGSVTLQIDYVASTGTATIDRKNDLLFDPYMYERELVTNDEICKLQKNIDNETAVTVVSDPFRYRPPKSSISAAQTTVVENPSEDVNYNSLFNLSLGELTVARTPEEKKKLLDKLDKLKKRMQTMQANKLINGLYGASLLHQTVFRQEVASSTIKKYTRMSILFAPAEDVRGKISGKLSDKVQLFNLGKYYADPTRFAGELTNIRESQAAAQSSVDIDENLENFIETGFGNQISGDEVNIEFAFFGDIIETAFEVLAANNRLTEGVDFFEAFEEQSSYVNRVQRGREGTEDPYLAENTELYVTPFYYEGGNTDSRIQELYKEYGEILLSNVTYKNPADVNQEITISLADVPISTIEFKKWFVKNISSKRKRHMFIKNYLESLTRWVSKQIGDAVAADQSTTTDLEPPELLVNRYFLNVDKYDFLPVITNSTRALQMLETRISIRNLSAYVDEQAVSQNLNSKVLTIIGQTPGVKFSTARSGNRNLDRDAKIPHILFADPDKGLLYNIQFQREDMPGLREARLFEGKDMYGLEILREKYNASLELYGNNFFKPGTIIYIDPGRLNVANFGYAKDGLSPARLLGLGGYHLVIRVTHEVRVADNAWMTMVDTQWQTFGSDDGLFARDQEDDCITSITARLAYAVDTDDPSARSDITQQAIEQAVNEGLTAPLQELQADPITGEAGFDVQVGAEIRNRFGFNIFDPPSNFAPVEDEEGDED
jgi:hypothetical protein